MNIIIATEVIVPGGAEAFVLRLSKAFQDRGHAVVVFGFYEDQGNSEIASLIAPDVRVVWAKYPMPALLRKIDGLLFRLKIDFSMRGLFVKRSLKKLLRRTKAEIIHSHLLKVDAMCVAAGKDLNIPVVTTIHGDYLQFYNKTKGGVAIPLLDYKRKAVDNLLALRKVVCISDKQLDFFKSVFPSETADKLTKIYNGYDSAKPAENTTALKTALGITEDDFVFGMVSRGIAEKGWQTAINAFLMLADPNAHLILVGEGEHLAELKKKYADEYCIHFMGNSATPLELINIFDVALLPSVYASESLPTVVIEYLFCGKPVIASDAGEISNMLQCNELHAGMVVPIVDGKVNEQELSTAMRKYMNDRQYYEAYSKNAGFCFEQFDMNKCISKYIDVYGNAIAENNSSLISK